MLADRVEQGRERLALLAAAEDRVDAALEGADADRGGGDVGRLGVVDEADAADLGDLLEAVRDAGEAAQPLAHRLAVEPHRERRGGGGHRVGDVVLAEEAELLDRQQRLAVVEDRPLGQRDLAVGRRAGAEGEPPGAAAEVGAGQRRVVGVVDGDVVVALVGEDPQLRRQVGLEVVVAVEVVGGEVEEDRALGREEARVLELEAGGLADHRRVRLDLPGQLRERRADVAGDRDRLTGAAVDVPEQLDRGRLAVRPGHRDEPVRQRPPGQLELPHHVDPPLQSGGDHRRLPGNARALDDSPRPLEQCKSIRIQKHFDANPRKPSRLFRRPRIDPPHPLPRPASSRAAACPDRASPTTRNGPAGSSGRTRLVGGAFIRKEVRPQPKDPVRPWRESGSLSRSGAPFFAYKLSESRQLPSEKDSKREGPVPPPTAQRPMLC